MALFLIGFPRAMGASAPYGGARWPASADRARLGLGGLGLWLARLTLAWFWFDSLDLGWMWLDFGWIWLGLGWIWFALAWLA